MFFNQLHIRLQVGEVVTTIPTIGFNVEQVTYKNLKFQVWDLGGQTSIRYVVLVYIWKLVFLKIYKTSLNFNNAYIVGSYLLENIFTFSHRPYWRCYYSNTDAIIYVVDSADRDRIGISKDELILMLQVNNIVQINDSTHYFLIKKHFYFIVLH